KRGAVYTARASVRGVPGRTLCLRVREWAGSDVVGSAQSCVTAARSWKQLSDASYTAGADGHSLDLYVYEVPARPRDTFDVDDVSLVEKDPAPALAPNPTLPSFRNPSPIDRPAPLYAPESPLNQPIPANAATDPSSPAMVQELVDEAHDKGWPVASNAWTNAVYFADASTPRYDVRSRYGVMTGVP